MQTLEREIANFFWHGPISKLEIMCIKSFVNNGFYVKLWSYNNIQIDGVESCDARLILDENLIYAYSMPFNNIHGVSLAAFSDIFRLKLLSKYDGWWFDTDCYCLKPTSSFESLRGNKNIVAGYQDHQIASGVLYLTKEITTNLLKSAESICTQYNNSLPFWGVIGPNLITEFVEGTSLQNQICESNCFYPIHYKESYKLLDVKYNDEVYLRIKDSYLIHLWDSMLINEYNLDKNNFPLDSFLEQLNK